MTGDDVVMINNRIISDLADGDAVDLTMPNDIAQVKTGKNGNSLFAFNAAGKQGELKMRVVRGSADDKFLNNLLAQQQNAFSSFALMIGQFVKKVGDGQGGTGSDTYITSGGVFQKIPAAKSNVEGDTNQSISEYLMKFSNVVRVIT